MTSKILTKTSHPINKHPYMIQSAGPWITDAEINLVNEAMKIGWGSNMNLHINQFTEEFSKFSGFKYCLPTTNCTSAIHLALIALGVGPGDEVIVPDITWVASASPIQYVGAKIVFCDIDQDNWCINPESFERCITKKTKAVVVVDLFGNMPRMKEICKIAKQYKISIIEDAAEGIGATYDGKPSGSFGKIGVYSFNGTKLIIAGQGGMVGTNDAKLFETSRLYGHHGIDKTPGARYYWSHVIGYNYNWTNIQAALCLAQLRRIDEIVERKRLIFSWYKERLSDVDGFNLNSEASNVRNTFWIVTGILSKKYKLPKETLQKMLREYNIDARPFFFPISSMPPFKKHLGKGDIKKRNPVSYGISPYGICLPSAATLKEDDVDHVCRVLKSILKVKS